MSRFRFYIFPRLCLALSALDVYKRQFPDSVVSYFKGMMGQPAWGFPEDLQKVVLKGEEPITCRPGELLEPVDFAAARREVEKFYPGASEQNIISWCLYPDVYKRQPRYRSITPPPSGPSSTFPASRPTSTPRPSAPASSSFWMRRGQRRCGTGCWDRRSCSSPTPPCGTPTSCLLYTSSRSWPPA